MGKAKQSDRQESKQKLYKIDVRSVVENHNPRNPLPERVRLATVTGKFYGLFTGETVTMSFKGGDEVIKLDVWQLGTSEDPQERAKYCELMEMDEEFVSWATTFLTVGQLEPVELRDNGRKGDNGNTYTLIYGARRCLAVLYNWCKLGGKGAPWVNAVLAPKLNETGLLHRSIVENIRKDPNPMEGARAIKMALNQGQEVAEVAQTYGKSESWVRSCLKLLELPVDVQRQIESGRLKPSKALADASRKPGEKPPAATKQPSAKAWKERTQSLAGVCRLAISLIEKELVTDGGEATDEVRELVTALRDALKAASEGE